MKLLISLLVLTISFDSIVSTCSGSCRIPTCYKWNPKRPGCLAGNVGLFSLYFKEQFNDYDIDAKHYSKSMRRLKEEYNDLYNYLYTFSEEQNEYAKDVKKKGFSYLKEIEKNIGDSQGYSELTEIKEEFSHVIEKGSSYKKEVEISGEGLGGKLMALTSTIDDDPRFVGKLLTKNPTDARRALMLFNPGCYGRCTSRFRGFFSIWYNLWNKCWAYFLRKKLRKYRCHRRKFLLKKFLRSLCRRWGLGIRVIRGIMKYWAYLMNPYICKW